MSDAVGAVLAYAVGVGLSPLPAVAVILVLFSERARANGPAFLAGWVAGLAVVFAVMAAAAERLDVGSDPKADEGVGWVAVVAGLLLLVAAAKKWRSRPGPDDQPEMPSWMGRIERFSPAQAFGAAALLAANPKNLALALGAAVTVAEADPTSGETVAATVAWVVVGSVAVALAVGYDVVGGERSKARLEDAKAWLTLHGSAVMAVLFTVFAALLVSKGLGLRG